MKRFQVGLAALAAAALLSACGGGGGGSTQGLNDPIVLNVAGLWTGSTASNQKITAVTYLDGTGWALLESASTEGYVQYMTFAGQVARGELGGMLVTHYLDSTAADANISMTALVVPKTAITMTTHDGGFGVYAGTYDSAFERIPDASVMAGTYTATVNYRIGKTLPMTPLSFQLTVDSSGAISGGNTECEVNGQLTPRLGKRDYVATMTIKDSGKTCPASATGLEGLVFQHQQAQKLFGYLANTTGPDTVTLSALKN